jgi:hypothetical protein
MNDGELRGNPVALVDLPAERQQALAADQRREEDGAHDDEVGDNRHEEQRQNGLEWHRVDLSTRGDDGGAPSLNLSPSRRSFLAGAPLVGLLHHTQVDERFGVPDTINGAQTLR